MRFFLLLPSALFVGGASAYAIISFSDNACTQNPNTIAPAGSTDQRVYALSNTLSVQLIPDPDQTLQQVFALAWTAS
jgi:hypothetical protein